MAICELPGTLRTSKELSNIEKKKAKTTYSMSSKILTYNPAFFLCLPTDLFTKHCHVKWWCLGRNTANTPCTPTHLPPLRCGCLSGDEICLSKAIYITASIPDSQKDQTLWYSYNVFPVFSNIQNIHFQFFVFFFLYI